LVNAATPRTDGIRVHVERVSAGADSARSLALAFAPLSRAMLVAASHAPPSVMVATSADSGLDAGKILKPLLEEVGGRGGGSARLAQGSAPTAEAVDLVVEQLLKA
jgi:alanyl-tRNA synthetase